MRWCDRRHFWRRTLPRWSVLISRWTIRVSWRSVKLVAIRRVGLAKERSSLSTLVWTTGRELMPCLALIWRLALGKSLGSLVEPEQGNPVSSAHYSDSTHLKPKAQSRSTESTLIAFHLSS
uniref:(northern house mosquito) hypothetical protein n=1 Tax=Culex pipiens TaxID=7175 RepID=A0A8D8A573_CULPI